MGLCPKPRHYSGNKSRFRFLGYACGERDGALLIKQQSISIKSCKADSGIFLLRPNFLQQAILSSIIESDLKHMPIEFLESTIDLNGVSFGFTLPERGCEINICPL